MTIALYIAAIVAANVLTAELNPTLIHVDGQIIAITAGTYLIGLTFFLRDFVQNRHGLQVAWLAIGAALLANLALSLHYDDLAWITIASAAAFAVSESTDTLVYTKVDGRLGPRILISGLVSCPIDSTIFVLVGLSPWTTGIIPWSAVLLTIVAQVVIKVALQLVAAIPTWRLQTA